MLYETLLEDSPFIRLAKWEGHWSKEKMNVQLVSMENNVANRSQEIKTDVVAAYRRMGQYMKLSLKRVDPSEYLSPQRGVRWDR